ncbi:hypothetical protein OSTOST_13359, partial [Ostertagia ostertagi]
MEITTSEDPQDAWDVSKYGKPDLFITFTCNPAWREVAEQLKPGQTPSDRPDIVARVFNIKLQELFTDLFKRQIFGVVKAYISVMEWQKRGLPHCHMLITLSEEDKPRSITDIDSIVQAVIPDRETEPRLHGIVTSCMMHRPCGVDNPHSPCMVDGKCSKRFPKQFRDVTTTEHDGYPEYSRPNDGRTVVSGGKVLDNRSVVPYNKYLALRYNGHLNVEICGMVQAVKYMYKYVYKGPDRAALHMLRSTDERDNSVINEIDEFVNARYVCAPEAVHRLLGFDLQTKSDTVCRLQVHLPDYQIVNFQGGQEEEAIRREAERDTTLTAFFKLNQEHELLYGNGEVPEREKDARLLLYTQIPEFFSFDQRTRKWKMRRRQNRQIGRMYTANPLDVERYSLRILLLNRRGPKSFNDLKTVDGVVHNTFKEAAKALGLMNDDSHYENCLSEASEFHMPVQLRSLFSSLLCFCTVIEPAQLWNKFKRAMAEDYIHRGVDPVEAIIRAYFDIMDRMAIFGADLRSLITPPSESRPAPLNEDELTEAEHVAYGEQLIEQLNEHQRAAANNILLTVNNADGRHFFIDGPGGSGKTFLYTALYHTLLGMRKNLNIHDNNRTCSMKRESREARALRNVSVIFWDEISMVPKWTLEAVDLLLKDIMQNEIPFGGKLMVIGGDFRQVLPVVERGQQEDLVDACIK